MLKIFSKVVIDSLTCFFWWKIYVVSDFDFDRPGTCLGVGSAIGQKSFGFHVLQPVLRANACENDVSLVFNADRMRFQANQVYFCLRNLNGKHVADLAGFDLDLRAVPSRDNMNGFAQVLQRTLITGMKQPDGLARRGGDQSRRWRMHLPPPRLTRKSKHLAGKTGGHCWGGSKPSLITSTMRAAATPIKSE
jgi:hypothetical protein